MTKLSRVKRCLRLPRNATGRDFVVGDLHGHRSLFERELNRIGFDPAHDRVLSVGDLVDRGPESLATLALLEEPWFHAVLGNHELMLLNCLGCYSSRIYSRKAYASGCGEWINEAVSKHRKMVSRLTGRIAALPLAIHVEGDVPFNVAHGDLQPIGAHQARLFEDETICIHEADLSTTSRENINTAPKADLLGLRFEQHSVQISPTLLGELPITYVGHSRLPQVMVHNSYVYIDQGVCTRSSKRALDTPPTLLDHRQFACWLEGVAAARGSPAAGPTGRAQAAAIPADPVPA